jgi:hypothetical protein
MRGAYLGVFPDDFEDVWVFEISKHLSLEDIAQSRRVNKTWRSSLGASYLARVTPKRWLNPTFKISNETTLNWQSAMRDLSYQRLLHVACSIWKRARDREAFRLAKPLNLTFPCATSARLCLALARFFDMRVELVEISGRTSDYWYEYGKECGTMYRRVRLLISNGPEETQPKSIDPLYSKIVRCTGHWTDKFQKSLFREDARCFIYNTH